MTKITQLTIRFGSIRPLAVATRFHTRSAEFEFVLVLQTQAAR